jgi:hypothetical protein
VGSINRVSFVLFVHCDSSHSGDCIAAHRGKFFLNMSRFAVRPFRVFVRPFFDLQLPIFHDFLCAHPCPTILLTAGLWHRIATLCLVPEGDHAHK